MKVEDQEIDFDALDDLPLVKLKLDDDNIIEDTSNVNPEDKVSSGNQQSTQQETKNTNSSFYEELKSELGIEVDPTKKEVEIVKDIIDYYNIFTDAWLCVDSSYGLNEEQFLVILQSSVKQLRVTRGMGGSPIFCLWRRFRMVWYGFAGFTR